MHAVRNATVPVSYKRHPPYTRGPVQEVRYNLQRVGSGRGDNETTPYFFLEGYYFAKTSR